MSRAHRFQVVAVTLLALSVSGCANWSKDVGKYRAELDQNLPTTKPAFGEDQPLPLVSALRKANDDNETIASSGEDYIQALAEKMRQAGVLLPTLTLGPSYTLSHTKGSSSAIVIPGTGGSAGTVVQTGNGGGTVHSTSVTANASIDGSLSDISNIKSSARTVEQRRQLLLDVRETILLQVADAYYDILRAEKQVGVLENSIALRQEQVRDQEARVRLGNARPLDLATSQSDLAATRVSLAQAMADVDNGRSALARLMGVDAVRGPLTDAFALPADPGDVEVWREQAVAQRQDLIAAARSTEAARLDVQAAIRRYYPSVSIDFNYFLYNDPSSSQKWTGGISASIPIFSAFQIEADIRAAWSRYRQAGLNESQTRRVVLEDIARSFRNLSSSREQLAYLQVQVEAAQRAFDLSDRAYKLGSETNIDRLTQQDNLLSARLNLIDQQFTEKAAYLTLLRSSGRLATVMQ